jgi:molybdate transport system substrate-binding protein
VRLTSAAAPARRADKAGAPVDVFDVRERRDDAAGRRPGRAEGTPAELARNVLQIAVPMSNPAGSDAVADLARAGVKVPVCAPMVPCGEAASGGSWPPRGVTPAAVTREQDVRAVLTKVRLGEVDAGLVYRTDVRASARDVTGIDIPGAERSANDYLVVVVRDGPATEPARAFVDYVRGERGRAALSAAGFVLP